MILKKNFQEITQSFQQIKAIVSDRINDSGYFETISNQITKLNKLYQQSEQSFHAVGIQEDQEQQLALQFTKQFDDLCTSIQLAIQNVVHKSNVSPIFKNIEHLMKTDDNNNNNNNDDDDNKKQSSSNENTTEQEGAETNLDIVEINETLQNLLTLLNGETIINKLSQLLSDLQRQTINNVSLEVKKMFCVAVYRLVPVLHQFIQLMRGLFGYSVIFHKSLCKLQYILSTICCNLYTKGFCKPEEEEEQQEGEMEDNLEGTGVGEGEGKKDVSEKIEDEDQIVGLKDQQQDQQQPFKPEEQEKGFEMENDFEGQMQDKQPKENDEQEDNDDNEEEQKEKQQQFGDFDSEQENVVDEKLWKDEDEEEEEEKEPPPEQKQQQEKREKNAPARSQKNDLVAKMDESNKDNNEEEDDKSNQPPQSDNPDEKEKHQEQSDQEMSDENEQNPDVIDKMEESHKIDFNVSHFFFVQLF